MHSISCNSTRHQPALLPRAYLHPTHVLALTPASLTPPTAALWYWSPARSSTARETSRRWPRRLRRGTTMQMWRSRQPLEHRTCPRLAPAARWASPPPPPAPAALHPVASPSLPAWAAA